MGRDGDEDPGGGGWTAIENVFSLPTKKKKKKSRHGK